LPELLLVFIVLVLYLRSYKYNYLVDDYIKRSGYLIQSVAFIKYPPGFYDQKKPILSTFTNISVFLASCGWVYHLFGWPAALIYAVHPLNVHTVCWNTGNYYGTTNLLVLTSFYFATFSLFPHFLNFPIVEYTIALCFYVAALGSTVSAIPFAFFIPIAVGLKGFIFIIPLLFYIFGKRFRTGLRLRKESHANKGIEVGKINIRRIFVMVKVIGYYIALMFWPSRLGIFHDAYKEECQKGGIQHCTRVCWLAFILIFVFGYWAYHIAPLGFWWFILFIGIFSQFTTFGQFITERYTSLALIGFCILMGQYITNENIFCIYTTLLFCRSWAYVPSFRNNETLFSDAISNMPQSPENYNNLALHYIERRQYARAIAPLLCALKYVDKNSVSIHLNLATCYEKSGYYESALQHLNFALPVCDITKIDIIKKWVLELNNKIQKIKKDKWLLKKRGII